MFKSPIAVALVVAAVICLALAIYYIIPGIYHPLTFSGKPSDSHRTHALAFFVLAVLGVLAARFAGSSQNR